MSPGSGLAALIYACCAQALPVTAKTYTAPADCAELSSCLPLMPDAALSSVIALTASVRPSSLRDNDHANWSPSLKLSALAAAFPVLEALMYACCAHVVPLRVKTYAAPACGIEWSSPLLLMPVDLLASPKADTANVLPSAL